jgi:hypothetical protein
MYYDYPPTAARSPGSMRQGYATVGLPSGLGGNRQGQRPLDSHGQHVGNPSPYGHDDRLGGGAAYESHTRFDRMAPSAMHTGYMMENSQTWGYNGGIATMNGNGRLGARAGNRRAALPSVSYSVLPLHALDVC